MKKIVYICSHDVRDDSDGVSKKIQGQRYGFMQNGFDVTIAGFTDNGVYLLKNDGNRLDYYSHFPYFKKYRRFMITKMVYKFYKSSSFTHLYLRYPTLTYAYLDLIKKLKGEGVCICLEVPSFPIPKTISRTFVERVCCSSRICQKYVDKIVYIGNKADTIFGCKAFQIPNGIPGVKPKLYHREKMTCLNEINMICPAWISREQAYENIIKVFYDYYSNPEKEKTIIRLFVVGDGPEKQLYEDMVKEFKLTKYIIFTGVLHDQALQDMYNSADIGFGAMSDVNCHYKMASKLKIKEYFQYALPFVYLIPEIDLPEDYKYALKISYTWESEVVMDRIIDFAKMVKTENFQKVEEEMHNYAKEHFFWESILKNVF